jgi:phospholipase/carboxylesterase
MNPSSDSNLLELLPAQGDAQQLFILLHGVGATADGLLPLAHVLQRQFPQAAFVLPQGFHAFDGGGAGRQWFSVMGVTEANRPARVAEALPALLAFIRATQQRLGIGAAATALVGFSQGSILSLEAIAQADGLAGRVLAFSGRYASLPAQAPRLTTLHLFHGGADPVIPAAHAREAIEHLGALDGDVTLDIAQGVGHELHPALVEQALIRLTRHVPKRMWQEAMGAAGAAGPASPAGVANPDGPDGGAGH